MLTDIHDFSLLREDFPILQQKNRGKPLVYLDSAASAQKPRQVVKALADFYLKDYANIHRGIYQLSEMATMRYEQIRRQVKNFIGASSEKEIIFVHGTTEGINLIAQSFGRSQWQVGDEIILSEMEHHANIVPWYFLKEQIGVELKIIPLLDDGTLDLETYKNLFSPRTKLVSVTHISNVLGTINPVKEMTTIAHQHGVPILLDGAQAVPHIPVNVSDLDCDFYTFSGHKLYGPTGIGVLFGKKNWLQEMPPFQGGGGMIEDVSFNHISFTQFPQRFEAGTPDIAGVIGLGAAIDYLEKIGMKNILSHEENLLDYALKSLASISQLKLLSTAEKKIGVLSFVLEHIHPHDLGTVLDHEGIAVRAGHHCAIPLLKRLQVPATVRVSLGLYNNEQDIDALVNGIELGKRLFANVAS